jgi:hypothetical protein
MNRLIVEVELSDDYKDVHPEITLDDFLNTPRAFPSRQITSELEAARAVVEAAKVSPCRHSSDLRGYDCGVCQAIAAYDAATKDQAK